MAQNGDLAIKVWGDLACFTRPENKVERVSYPVMTPSAARGILEAVLWKPEFSWVIRRIKVLNPIAYHSFTRNELSDKQSHRTLSGWDGQGAAPGVVADASGGKNRAQRHTLALRDVAYIIEADIDLRSHAGSNDVKYRDMFRRRVRKGQCFHQPYLGCREFAASFGEPEPDDQPFAVDMDLGRMLLENLFLKDPKGPIRFRRHGPEGAKEVRGRNRPVFFDAHLEQGVLEVPEAVPLQQEA